MSGAVVIRCDSSRSMGVGHLSRCATLARCMMRHGLKPRFVCRVLPGDQRHFLYQQGFTVVDLENGDGDAGTLVSEAERLGAGWILLDHPELGIDHEREIGRLTRIPLAVIDGQFRSHDCALLLNPNVYATRDNCLDTVSDDCIILAGYDYFLLRESFTKASDHEKSRCPSVLITLGGADPDNLTLSICRQLSSIDIEAVFHVVMGPANPYTDSVTAYLAQNPDPRIRLYRQPENFETLLATCTICISAGGVTLGEAAFLGKPVIALVIAENQRRSVTFLARRGALIEADPAQVGVTVSALLLDADRRSELSGAIHGLVDGRGAERVVTAMLDALPKPGIH